MADLAQTSRVARAGVSSATKRRQWFTVGLLILAGVVNYVDRSTLAVANHTIAGELHLSPSEMGALLSAFAWSYALCQLPIGLITDRVGPHLMLSLGMTLWSVAQIISGTVGSFWQFMTARAGLGVGESPMFTAGARATVNWFPLAERGFPLGLFNAASSLGPAVAPPLLTALMLAYGWRTMFVAMGVAGLAVAIGWWLYYRDPEQVGVPDADRAAIHAGEVEAEGHTEAEANPHTWAKLFAVPSTWGLMGGLFGIVYVTWLNVAWLPDYLESERGVSVADTGWLAAVPQVAGCVGGALGGYLSDWLARRGLDPVDSRRYLTVGGLVLCALFTALAPVAPTTTWVIAALSASMFFGYGAGACSWALGASLTPPRLVATLESIQNIGGSIGGALAPFVTGVIVERTHGFTPAFLVATVAALAGAASYWTVRREAYAEFGR